MTKPKECSGIESFWVKDMWVEMKVHRRAGIESQHVRQRSRLDKTMAKTVGWVVR